MVAALSGVAAQDELDAIANPAAPVEFKVGELKWRLPKCAKWNGTCLVIDAPASAEHPGGMAETPIDLSGHEGRLVTLKLHTKSSGVGKTKVSYHGFKFQVALVYEDGYKAWPSCDFGRDGDWEGENVLNVNLLEKPLKSATLQLGLQGVGGHAEYDLATLKAVDGGVLFPRVNCDHRAVYTKEVRQMPRYRGVMLPGRANEITEDCFITLEKWGANLARFQLSKDWNTIGAWTDLGEYDRYVDGELDLLERNVLPWAAKHGVRICIDLHAAPGARVNGQKELRMCYEKKYADHFVSTWQKIARRFGGDRRIYGFDLINEPVQKAAAPYSYLHLQLAAARAIRKLDSKTPIIIESNEYDSARTFAYLSPLKLDNIIYQAHCYVPMDFTHQGIHGKPKTNLFEYPNPKKGWDREFIRRQLQPVRDFQLKHGARIYIGEFSAAIWAPGAENYIRDAISIFEEYGWDWSYHAFRESKMWSVEHDWQLNEKGRDIYTPSEDNPRRRALLEGFKKGKR